MNKTQFCAGANTETVTLKDAEGHVTIKENPNGTRFYECTNHEGIWYRLKFVIDPDSKNVLVEIYSDEGTFLGSAEWVHASDFPDSIVKDVRVHSPYTNANNGAVQRRTTLDVSEVKVTYVTRESAPAAMDVAISEENGVVTGNYTYMDANQDEEQDSYYRFLRGKDLEDIAHWEVVKEGSCTAQTLPTYTFSEEDYDNYIVFEITPRSANEPKEGMPVQSTPLLGPCVPVASDVSIEGGCVVGREVTGKYSYYDENDDDEENSVYAWLVCDTENGEFQAVEGADEITFTIPQDFSNKYIKFQVTPKNGGIDDQTSIPVSSEAYLVTSSNRAPEASNVKITGQAAISAVVSGSYTFVDEDGDEEGNSVYQWYSAAEIGSEPVAIPGENGREMQISELFAGQYLYFEVTPVDAFGQMGTTVRSEPVQVQALQTNTLYVSLDGNDENEGTLDAPFATLEKARDTLREWQAEGKMPYGGVTVYVRGGVYSLSETFALTEQDSGTANSPIVYRPYGEEQVTISGGKEVDLSKFVPVSGEMKDKLRSADAQSKVMVGDLEELGLSDLQSVTTNQSSARYILCGPMFSIDKQSMTLAHWPNSNYRNDWESVVVKKSTPANQTAPIQVQYQSDIISNWTHNLEDIWYLGYWRFDWAAEFVQGTLDQSAKTLDFTTPTHYTAEAVGKTRNLIAYNVYEEIDEPGEYYVDYTNGKMYFYPVEGMDSNSKMTVTDQDFDLISMNNVSYVTFQGFEMTGSQKGAVVMTGGSHNTIDRCDIHLFESIAISITGTDSNNNGVKNSKIYQCGQGAIILDGGNKETLTPANNFISNCEIYDFSMQKEVYGPAIDIKGAGNLLDHNEFYNSQHMVVRFQGVNHIIEFNKFHNVCRNAADMGVIYTGRSLADQGVVIRYNHFYEVGNEIESQFSPCCVFTDDGSSNLRVYGNVVGPGVNHVEPFKVHGGIDNQFYNNLFIDSPNAIYQATWTKDKWFKSVIGDEVPTLRDSFNSVKDNALYLEQWPYLKDLNVTSASQIAYLEKYPNIMKNNVLLYVNQTPVNLFRSTGAYGIKDDNNLQLTGNPELYKTYVKDWEGGNYTLTDQAYTEIRKVIPEFETIPFEAIGSVSIQDSLPQAQNVKIYRQGEQTLAGSYVYYDADRDPEGETTVRWLVSETDNENDYTPISGADSMSFTYTEEYSGRYICFEVTPKDAAGKEGTPVRSPSVKIITNREEFLERINEIKELVNEVTVGTGLGQYPTSAVNAINAAVEEAEEAYGSDATETQEGLAAAVEQLEQAVEAFLEARIRSVTDSRASGEITIPSDLDRMEVTLSQVTGTFTLKGPVLPKGTIYAVINGKRVAIEISEPVTLPGGEFEIERLEQSSAPSVQGTVLACRLGDYNESYQPALKVTVEEVGGKQLSFVKDGTLEQAADLTVSGENLQFSLTEGNEIVVYQSAEVSSDSSLKSLAVNGIPISLEAGKLNYSISLDAGTTQAVITAEANHAGPR